MQSICFWNLSYYYFPVDRYYNRVVACRRPDFFMNFYKNSVSWSTCWLLLCIAMWYSKQKHNTAFNGIRIKYAWCSVSLDNLSAHIHQKYIGCSWLPLHFYTFSGYCTAWVTSETTVVTSIDLKQMRTQHVSLSSHMT